MRKQEQTDALVVARMKELADNRTPWHRALWQPGTIVMLSEVREAVEATWAGALTSDDAMRDVIAGAIRQVERDPGIGTVEVRGQLSALLKELLPGGGSKSKPTADLQKTLDRVTAYVERCRTGYLLRWIEHVASPGIGPDDLEGTARLLVSHLVDEGLDRGHIHGWLTNVAREIALSEIVSRAREMLLQAPRTFNFMVSVVKAPKEFGEAFGDNWRTGEEFVEAFRLATNPKNVPVPRVGAGALDWSSVNRDPHAAMAELAAWQQRIIARADLGYGTANRVEFSPDIVDSDGNRVRSLRSDSRPLRVASIQRSKVYGMSSPYAPQLDGAIGLLASHSTIAAGPSVASVWAAAEGLLGRAGGRGVDVADRLADIVTCSFPRAELGELARVWASEGIDDLARDLKPMSSAEQAQAMAESLTKSGDPGFRRPSDRAAVARYVQLSRDPVAILGRVRMYYSSAFRRLYYQRNFIMHAAKFDSVTLGVTARTAPLLVAAALDRIVNAQHGDSSIGPLDLAARAENELKLLGLAGARPLHLLLD